MTTNLATLDDLKARMGSGSSDTRHDTQLQASLDDAAALLEELCNRPLDSVERTERFHGDATSTLVLPYPVQADSDPVVKVRRSQSDAWETVADSELETFATYNPLSTGIHWLEDEWPVAEYQTVEVTWTTGYDDGTAEAAPTVVRLAVLSMAAALFNTRRGAANPDGPEFGDPLSIPFVAEVVRGFKTVRQARSETVDLFAPVGTGRIRGGKENLYYS